MSFKDRDIKRMRGLVNKTKFNGSLCRIILNPSGNLLGKDGRYTVTVFFPDEAGRNYALKPENLFDPYEGEESTNENVGNGVSLVKFKEGGGYVTMDKSNVIIGDQCPSMINNTQFPDRREKRKKSEEEVIQSLKTDLLDILQSSLEKFRLPSDHLDIEKVRQENPGLVFPTEDIIKMGDKISQEKFSSLNFLSELAPKGERFRPEYDEFQKRGITLSHHTDSRHYQLSHTPNGVEVSNLVVTDQDNHVLFEYYDMNPLLPTLEQLKFFVVPTEGLCKDLAVNIFTGIPYEFKSASISRGIFALSPSGTGNDRSGYAKCRKGSLMDAVMDIFYGGPPTPDENHLIHSPSTFILVIHLHLLNYIIDSVCISLLPFNSLYYNFAS